MNRKNLLQELLQDENPQQILQFLEVIRQLLLRYGRKLTFPDFLKGLEKISPEIGALICLLDHMKMLKLSRLSSFIREFQIALPREQLQFHLESDDEDIIAPLTSYLEERFGKVQVDYKPLVSDNLSVKMKGQGYIFKRSLEKDIDKLLA